jgi:hypothetical protein
MSISKDLAIALKNGYKIGKGNSCCDGENLYVHGNKIATYKNGFLTIDDCGYKTNLTSTRLNEVLKVFGLNTLKNHKYNRLELPQTIII